MDGVTIVGGRTLDGVPARRVDRSFERPRMHENPVSCPVSERPQGAEAGCVFGMSDEIGGERVL